MASGSPFGAYRLVRRLGAGGMAEVFLARREGPGGFEKHLVIKRILPHLAGHAELVEMFLREARVAALIDHPNLVHVSDFGEIDGEHYLAMEYVDGFTLTEVVRRIATLTPGAAVRIAVDVLEALSAVHAARGPDGQPLGLVHRDVSPTNVMLTRDGVVKLLDFGIAVAKDDDTSRRMGTRRFMSPEQLAGAAQDARSDLFSVGVLLYALITGRAPYPELPIEVPERPDDVPEDLWPTMQSALHPDREARPESARALQAPLELFLSTRGAEGTRSHLASVLQSVLPARSPAERAVSRLTAQLGSWTRAVTGTLGTRSEAEPTEGAAPTVALAAPEAPRPSRAPLILSLLAFGLFAAIGVSAVRGRGDAEFTAEPVAAAPRAPEPTAPPQPAPQPEPEPEAAPTPAPPPEPPRAKPAPRRRARPKPKPSPGRLTIDTRPWTEVFLGDRRLGMTPLQGIELPSGRHRLRLENPKVGLETTLTVRIRPGKETRIKKAL